MTAIQPNIFQPASAQSTQTANSPKGSMGHLSVEHLPTCSYAAQTGKRSESRLPAILNTFISFIINKFCALKNIIKNSVQPNASTFNKASPQEIYSKKHVKLLAEKPIDPNKSMGYHCLQQSVEALETLNNKKSCITGECLKNNWPSMYPSPSSKNRMPHHGIIRDLTTGLRSMTQFASKPFQDAANAIYDRKTEGGFSVRQWADDTPEITEFLAKATDEELNKVADTLKKAIEDGNTLIKQCEEQGFPEIDKKNPDASQQVNMPAPLIVDTSETRAADEKLVDIPYIDQTVTALAADESTANQ